MATSEEAVLSRLSETWRGIEELNSVLRSIQSCVEQKNSQAVPGELERIRSKVEERYDQALGSVTDVLQLVSSILNRPREAAPLRTGAPSPDDVHTMMLNFFKKELPTRSPPLPTHCGCYAHKISAPEWGQFVCAHVKESFILMIVVKAQENGECSVFDPADVGGGVNVIELQRENWTALPTVIPMRPLQRWEFPVGAEVLSLWPNGEEWTTEFYRATVVSTPHQRRKADDRGYELSFDGEVKVVPEKFVVALKKEWKK